jgi:hypothetical protein
MTIELNENHFVEFERKHDHLMVWAHPFANESPKAPSKSPVEFILDSGAMITMIDLGTAEELKYTSLPVKRSTTLGGVVPGCSIAVDYKVIEGIKIAGLRLSKVTVAMFERSILGQNILEYFNYFMDTGNDKIYFAKNPNPKPISEDAKCGVVFTVGE